jgi:hypothetical protein
LSDDIALSELKNKFKNVGEHYANVLKRHLCKVTYDKYNSNTEEDIAPSYEKSNSFGFDLC